MAKILLVEDDDALSHILSVYLTARQHIVERVDNGEDALDRLSFYGYDLVILDWTLPKLDGITVLERFRQRGGIVPVLMFTSRISINHKELGFELGADDYLTKPFHISELTARVAALLRRPPTWIGETIKIGELSINSSTRQVFVRDKEVQLHPKEYAILEFLMRHPGHVFRPEDLINYVWSSVCDTSPESIRAYMAKLRSKIEIEGKKSIIKTVHGFGYKLEAIA